MMRVSNNYKDTRLRLAVITFSISHCFCSHRWRHLA